MFVSIARKTLCRITTVNSPAHQYRIVHKTSALYFSNGDGAKGGSDNQQKSSYSSYSSPVPIALLAAAGVASAAHYYYQAHSPRKQDLVTDHGNVHQSQPLKGNANEPELTIPVLEPLAVDTAVVFVLGGPGAGKGTQCAKLVKEFGYVHLSAGDILRDERNRQDSPYGELINRYIKEGQIVPMEITIALLHAAMKQSGSKRFLIDGFPRKMDQALKFEEMVCKSKLVMYFECPEEEMLKRLLKRGETSGRVDDNLESIKKRFQIFHETSYPVIEYYAALGKVQKVSCLQPIDKVFEDTKKIFDKLHL
ncbi:bifunctional uridylate/adenylate kinase [Batrachochytrium dendrobatidis]